MNSCKVIRTLAFIFLMVAGAILVTNVLHFTLKFSRFLNVLIEGSQQSSVHIAMYSAAGFSLMLMGVGVVILAILGIMRARDDRPSMAKLNMAVSTVLLLAVSGFTVSIVLRSPEDSLDPLRDSIKKYGIASTVTLRWNQIQTEYECCGANNFTDWTNISHSFPNQNGHQVPDSCCPTLDQTCLKTPKDCNNQDDCQNLAKSCLIIYGDLLIADRPMYIVTLCCTIASSWASLFLSLVAFAVSKFAKAPHTTDQ